MISYSLIQEWTAQTFISQTNEFNFQKYINITNLETKMLSRGRYITNKLNLKDQYWNIVRVTKDFIILHESKI